MNHVNHFPGIIPPAVANGLLNLLCLTPDLAAATLGSLWALFALAHLPVQVEQFEAQAPVLRSCRCRHRPSRLSDIGFTKIIQGNLYRRGAPGKNNSFFRNF